MASTPQITVIEDAVIAAIVAIAAAPSSYNYTYTSVVRHQRDIAAIARNALPAVDVAFNGEIIADEPGMRRCEPTWLITAVAAVTATNETEATAERATRSRRMRDDLKAALYGSAALHGTAATMVWFDQYDDDTANTAARGSSESHATCRFLLRARYFEPLGLTLPLT